MGELDGRVDAALGLQPGVRSASGDADVVQRDALALGLERSAVGRASRTSAAEARRASSSISPRELGEPISSSPVTRIVTPSRPAAAWNAITSPAFMSKQPGPRRTPSSTVHGRVGQRAERPDRVVVAEQQDRGGSVTEPPAQVGAAVEDDPLGLDPEPGGADLGHHLGRARHRVQVGRRRLALDQGADVRQQQVEVGHGDTRGVARAPKCT